jgi:hypothetical protein
MKKTLDQPNRRNNPMHKSTDYSKQIQKNQMQFINQQVYEKKIQEQE